jgi:hypothetical protein
VKIAKLHPKLRGINDLAGSSSPSQSPQRSHAVAYDTARRDLLELVKEGLLMMHKEGKKFVFTRAGELGRRVR